MASTQLPKSCDGSHPMSLDYFHVIFRNNSCNFQHFSLRPAATDLIFRYLTSPLFGSVSFKIFGLFIFEHIFKIILLDYFHRQQGTLPHRQCAIYRNVYMYIQKFYNSPFIDSAKPSLTFERYWKNYQFYPEKRHFRCREVVEEWLDLTGNCPLDDRCIKSNVVNDVCRPVHGGKKLSAEQGKVVDEYMFVEFKANTFKSFRW